MFPEATMTTEEAPSTLRRSSRITKVSKKTINSDNKPAKKTKNLEKGLEEGAVKESLAVKVAQTKSTPDSRNFKVILLDIEGTTTSISFVKDILFPYVKTNLAAFLQTNWESKECQECIAALVELSAKDVADACLEGMVAIPELSLLEREKQVGAVVQNVEWMMVLLLISLSH